MKRAKYLNVILTVIAVLLSAIVWVSVADRPLMSSSAHATPPGVPDAGSQRQGIRRAVEAVEADIELLHKLLVSGRVRVEVSNLSQLARDDASGSSLSD